MSLKERIAEFPWKDFGRRTVKQSLGDDVAGLAAELAYRFFLALFPFVIFLAALGSFVAATLPVENPAQTIVESVSSLLPPAARGLIESELQSLIESRNLTLTSVSVLFALMFATGGMNAIIKALNRVYDVAEGRSFWRRYPVAFALTLVAGAAMLSAFLLFGPVRILAPRIADLLGIEQAAALLIDVVAFGGAFLLVVGAAITVFRLAPHIKLPLRALWPGAVLFAVAWLVATIALNFYVANFGNYANTYGTLAGVALLLIWFYISALVFLIAGEVNAVLHTLTAPDDLERRQVESAEQASDAQQEDG